MALINKVGGEVLDLKSLTKSAKQSDWKNRGRESLWLVSILFAVGLFLSAIIPPFQSPDEPAHIERAYLLAKGVIVLDKNEAQASGGAIDTGLSEYFYAFNALPFKPHKKLSVEELEPAQSIRWTGIKEFVAAPGAGYYFPLIYTPQALGLAIGEKLDATVHVSYQLARFLSLASIALILFAAFTIYPVSPLVVALLFIPMSVFQISSASLDGISTALAILSIAAFFRISDDKERASPWLFYLLTLAVILVATSRIHLLPLLLLLLASCFYIKEKKYFAVFLFALLFVLAWLVIAINTTGATRTSAPTSSIALQYIKNPLSFFEVLFKTLSDNAIVEFYRNSFLGVLGWLDTSFSKKTYRVLSICLALIGMLSISPRSLKDEWAPRLFVFFAALSSILLVFFLLLITWTPDSATRIEGVQGRYFMVPMIMIAYAVSGREKLYEGIFRKAALLIVILLIGFTIVGTSRLLVERYYLSLEKTELPELTMRPSQPLEQSRPISLFLGQHQKSNPRPIKRIGIQFGTYGRNNPGTAMLQLNTPDGETTAISFELSELMDNRYRYFELDLKPYISGQVIYSTGGGISSWEAHDEKGTIATCLILEYPSGAKRYTRGCPRS